MQGTLPASELNSLRRVLGVPCREFTDEECTNILASIAVELFADSNPENDHLNPTKRPRKPLGLLAETWMIRLTCPPEIENATVPVDVSAHLEYIPLLNLYGQVEEQYLN